MLSRVVITATLGIVWSVGGWRSFETAASYESWLWGTLSAASALTASLGRSDVHGDDLPHRAAGRSPAAGSSRGRLASARDDCPKLRSGERCLVARGHATTGSGDRKKKAEKKRVVQQPPAGVSVSQGSVCRRFVGRCAALMSGGAVSSTVRVNTRSWRRIARTTTAGSRLWEGTPDRIPVLSPVPSGGGVTSRLSRLSWVS